MIKMFIAIFAGIFVSVLLLSSCGSPLSSINKCNVTGEREVPAIDTKLPIDVEIATFSLG